MNLSLIFAADFPNSEIRKGILRKKIRLIAAAMELRESVEFAHIEINLMDAEELRKYNKQHLNHDYETDILTFDLSDGKRIEGQILISWENVMENSVRFRTGFKKELLRVIIHGLLHLSGYGDLDEKQSKLMRKKENEYLKHLDNAGKGN